MRFLKKIFLIVLLNVTLNNLAFSSIPDYIPPTDGLSNVNVQPWNGGGGVGCYLAQHFLDHIPKDKIHCIIEIGSRDAIDSLALSEHYQKHVFCFECNPYMLNQCIENIGSNKNVTLVPFAAWNENGSIPFYPVKEKNPGASSCYQISKSGSHFGLYQQNKVTVQAVRMEDWMKENDIEEVDLLCMDAQGATLPILEGFGDKIYDVKYIITEVIYRRIYDEEKLYPEIKSYLTSKGFTVFFEDTELEWNDVLFIRKDLLN